MTPAPRRIVALLAPALLLALLSTALPGCGKRGGLEPPEDKKGEYTYPRKYPR